jgi:hypothetical protein
MNYLEVGKQLMKSKAMANFRYYSAGKLYYKVELEDGTYQFPISTVEAGPVSVREEIGEHTIKLASDLGATPFLAEMRGSELNRWIRKAIESGDFIQIG